MFKFKTKKSSKKISLHLYPSSFSYESRMLRSCRSALKEKIIDEVLILAVLKDGLPHQEYIDKKIKVIRLEPMKLLNKKFIPSSLKALSWYISSIKTIINVDINYINCHSIFVLPLSVFLKFWKKALLIYEPHELETETIMMKNKFIKTTCKILEKYFINFSDSICVVNPSIASWYKEKYDLKKIWIVKNISSIKKIKKNKSGKLRGLLKINKNEKVFLYQGLLDTGRGLDILIRSFQKIKKYHIVFIGYGSLKQKLVYNSNKYKNIHFLDAVNPDQLLEYTIDADVGIALIENCCLSYYYSLPNKVFEYAACDITQIVSYFTEMKKFILTFDCIGILRLMKKIY